MENHVEKRYSLNVAQLRNLRNWSSDERSVRVIAVLVPLTTPKVYEDCVTTMLAFLGRHEALRSRVAGIDTERPLIEVLEPKEAEAQFAIDRVETPDPSVADTTSPQTVDIDPRRCAAHCTLFSHAGYVHAIRLTVSHVFTDALGLQALFTDLKAILSGEPALTRDRLPQASLFARGPDDPRVKSNTDKWRKLLTGVPRSCTYSRSHRDQFEMVEYVELPLTASDVECVRNASRQVKTSPYIVWAAIISSLVDVIAGASRQVFRSTYANRFTPDDYSAVAQLAQAVYVPVDGRENDSFRSRACQVADVTSLTYEWGTYDALGLLEWLNEDERACGVIFQPAFELNYMPSAGSRGVAGVPERTAPPEPRSFQSMTRIDPPSAKADIAVSVSYEPSPLARFSFRRPVSEMRAPADLADDCYRLMRHLCADPDMTIKDVPVRPLVAERGLCRGHHSGVAIDLGATRDLVESCPGVARCALTVEHGNCGEPVLHAQVLTSARISRSALLGELTRRQPWLAGSIVPDRIEVAHEP